MSPLPTTEEIHFRNERDLNHASAVLALLCFVRAVQGGETIVESSIEMTLAHKALKDHWRLHGYPVKPLEFAAADHADANKPKDTVLHILRYETGYHGHHLNEIVSAVDLAFSETPKTNE